MKKKLFFAVLAVLGMASVNLKVTGQTGFGPTVLQEGERYVFYYLMTKQALSHSDAIAPMLRVYNDADKELFTYTAEASDEAGFFYLTQTIDGVKYYLQASTANTWSVLFTQSADANCKWRYVNSKLQARKNTNAYLGANSLDDNYAGDQSVYYDKAADLSFWIAIKASDANVASPLTYLDVVENKTGGMFPSSYGNLIPDPYMNKGILKTGGRRADTRKGYTSSDAIYGGWGPEAAIVGSDEAYSGSYALKVWNKANWGSQIGASIDMNLSSLPNSKYLIRAMIKSDTYVGAIGVVNGGNGRVTVPATNNKWEQLEGVLSLSGSNLNSLFLNNDAGTAGNLYLDNYEVYPAYASTDADVPATGKIAYVTIPANETYSPVGVNIASLNFMSTDASTAQAVVTGGIVEYGYSLSKAFTANVPAAVYFPTDVKYIANSSSIALVPNVDYVLQKYNGTSFEYFTVGADGTIPSGAYMIIFSSDIAVTIHMGLQATGVAPETTVKLIGNEGYANTTVQDACIYNSDTKTFVYTSGASVVKPFEAYVAGAAGDVTLVNYATPAQLGEISLKADLATALLTEVMSTSVKNELQAALQAAREITSGNLMTVAQDALDALAAAVTVAQASAASYGSIKTAMDIATDRMTYLVNYPEYDTFAAAANEAIGTLNTVYTEKVSDITAVSTALTTFVTTYYPLEKAVRASSITGVDYTDKITNPDFADNVTTGWTNPGGPQHGVCEFFNTTFNTYQSISDLPAGVYELNVQAYHRMKGNDAGAAYKLGAEDITAYLYATTGEGKEWKIPLLSLYAETYSSSTDRLNGYPNMRQAANIAFNTEGTYKNNALKNIPVEAGETLTIGIKMVTKSGETCWVCYDNFSLAQISAASSTAAQAEIDALKVLTDKAESLLLGDISPAANVLGAEKDLHVAYEAGVTESSVVLAAIQTMTAAIETYRSAYIKNYSFEDPADPSTAGVSPTLANWTRNYTDGYNWNGCNGDWKTDGNRSYGIYKDAIDSDFELSQVVTVPNGMYLVSVDMTVSKSGITSRVNGQCLFAGHAENYYPVYAETDTDNGAATTLSVLTVVNDGRLKLGVRTNGGTTSGIGWFKIDNFTIKQVSTSTHLELIDWMDFNATENQTIDVSYGRSFMTTGVNSTTTNGWQSLCLPFDVTRIEIADTYSQRYIDLTDKANEKFWLYKISESGYTPAYTIEAHEYYLMALPNDEDYYAPGVSLSGYVTFYGTEVLATPALPKVELPLFYVQANFKATNPGYGITDVDNNSVFKQYHNNGTFWVHALPKDGNGSFDAFNVFGPTDPTSLRQTDMGDAVSQLAVAGVEGGLEITVAVSQMIRIYTLGGELVKAFKVPAGTTRISLPVGQYIVNSQKVVVNK